MDPIKTGERIRQLRTELHLTQRQLAVQLHVSDKAVSKWERGKGCPDISLLSALADVFGADLCSLISGEIEKRESEKGNMKKLKFYVCRTCGNIITATSEAAVSCCGTRLSALEPRKAEESEMLNIEEIGDELFVTGSHPMTKEHYISFVAYVTDSTVMICKQYPEWDLQCSLPLFRFGRIIWYCASCGLLYHDVRRKSAGC